MSNVRSMLAAPVSDSAVAPVFAPSGLDSAGVSARVSVSILVSSTAALISVSGLSSANSTEPTVSHKLSG